VFLIISTLITRERFLSFCRQAGNLSTPGLHAFCHQIGTGGVLSLRFGRLYIKE